MKRYDWVFFDMDGTLVKSDPGIVRCLTMVLGDYGVDVAGMDLQKFIGPPLNQTFARLLGDRAAEAVTAYRALYLQKGVYECALYPGVLDMLKALAPHYKLAIASAKVQRAVETILMHLGIAEYFSLVVGSLPDGSRSEKHESIGHLLYVSGASPDRVLMIGDRDLDLIGADKSGVHGLGVLHGYGSRAELEACKRVAVVDSADDVVRYLLE